MIDCARTDPGSRADCEILRLLSRRQHDRPYWKAIFAGKLKIALIMRGTTEDGPGAIIHQHEIGDPNREFFSLQERVNNRKPSVIALLFGSFDRGLAGAETAAVSDERFRSRITLGDGG